MKRRLHHRINLILLGLIVLVLIGSCMSRIELGPGKPEPSADTGKPPVQTPDGQPGADEPGADPSEPASPGSDDQAPAGDSPSDAGQADGDGNADGQPGGNQPGGNQPGDDQQGDAQNEGDSTPPPADEAPADATLIAVGDVMMHAPQLPGAYDERTKTYDFKSFFSPVKPILEQGDWTLANLETPIAGKPLGLSGYPRFNAPPELADALKYAGFTTVTNANNHAMDRGAQGIAMSLAKLQTLGFDTKGTARSKAEADKLTIVTHNGISMGLLAYTYGTNGIPLPKEQPYAVSLIDEQAMIRDIGRLKKAGADFITVCLHFGTEYQTMPNDAQKQLARALVAAGADIIAGSHPHVVQPYEFAEVTNPDGSVRKGLIIYSMGNFISNQRGDTKDYGVIYKVRIHKEHGLTTIGDVKPIPTWVHRTSVKGVSHYAVVPVADVLAAKSLPDLTVADYATLKSTYVQVSKRIASMHSAPVHLQAAP